MAAAALQTVDHSALKVNQAGIVLTVLVAFFASFVFPPAWLLVPLLAIVLLAVASLALSGSPAADAGLWKVTPPPPDAPCGLRHVCICEPPNPLGVSRPDSA